MSLAAELREAPSAEAEIDYMRDQGEMPSFMGPPRGPPVDVHDQSALQSVST